jgi:hypothetical protein
MLKSKNLRNLMRINGKHGYSLFHNLYLYHYEDKCEDWLAHFLKTYQQIAYLYDERALS